MPTTDDRLAEIESRIDDLEEENEQLRRENKELQENSVHLAVVERVLLEYGIPSDDVDEMLTDFEKVETRMMGGEI